MKFLKTVFDFYIYASIHVAIAVICLVRITELYLNLPYDKNLLIFIFLGTITGYNFVKYAGVAKLHHKSLTSGLQIIQVFSFICFLALCYYAFLIPVKTLLFGVPFIVLTAWY